MPTKHRRENTFITRFLSAYENYSWVDAQIQWLDQEIDGAIEALATRRSDEKTLAIEHTIIEPFMGEKEDFAFFETAFLKIEKDASLLIPGRWIRVFVPAGILRGQRKQPTRNAIVESVHNWLKENCSILPYGLTTHHGCEAVISGQKVEIPLQAKVVPLRGQGSLWVRRQQVENNLDKVIERALKKKLPKLVGTPAHKRILILERQHMNLLPDSMLAEIERQRSIFKQSESVDEIWILETMSYEHDLCIGFERFESGTLVGQMFFQGDQLLDKFENGEAVVVATAV